MLIHGDLKLAIVTVRFTEYSQGIGCGCGLGRSYPPKDQRWCSLMPLNLCIQVFCNIDCVLKFQCLPSLYARALAGPVKILVGELAN